MNTNVRSNKQQNNEVSTSVTNCRMKYIALACNNFPIRLTMPDKIRRHRPDVCCALRGALSDLVWCAYCSQTL